MNVASMQMETARRHRTRHGSALDVVQNGAPFLLEFIVKEDTISPATRL